MKKFKSFLLKHKKKALLLLTVAILLIGKLTNSTLLLAILTVCKKWLENLSTLIF